MSIEIIDVKNIKLIYYKIDTVTEGTDALGEVVVKIDIK